MVKRIIWTNRALIDYHKILIYWKKRNKSAVFSLKLSGLINEAIELLSKNPKLGRKTDDGKARVKIIRDYHIIYEEESDRIIILMIWDSRRDPEKLKEQLRKRK